MHKKDVVVYILQDSSEIIAFKTTDTITGDVFIMNPLEVVYDHDENFIRMLPWLLVDSEDGIYPVPIHIVSYVPCKKAKSCYIGWVETLNDTIPKNKKEISKLN